jgi:hypothetical protein
MTLWHTTCNPPALPPRVSGCKHCSRICVPVQTHLERVVALNDDLDE